MKGEKFLDPINYHMYKTSDYLAEILHNIPCINMTPNKITIFRFCLSLISLYLIYTKQNYHIAAILYFLDRYLDTTDGVYARKYNMKSKYGDKLEHTLDIISGTLLLYVIYKTLKIKSNALIPVILTLLMASYVGCLEKYIQINDKKSKSNTMMIVESTFTTCPDSMYKNHNTLKYIGGYGFFSIYMALFIWNFDKLSGYNIFSNIFNFI